MYRQVSERFPVVPIRSPAFQARSDYGVLLINLDENPDRLARAETAFQDTPVPMHRVPGIRGSYLPSVASLRLAGSGKAPRGTLGTFLAHAAAWEAMLELKLAHGLIIEDDALPVINLPSRLSVLGVPDDFDLCFVNERMQHQNPVEPTEIAEEILKVYSIFSVVESWPNDFNAPGADGYLLSAEGARKLLEFVNRDGFSGDVDWRLLGYCVTPGDYSRLNEKAVAFHVLRQTDRYGPGRLTAYSLFPCLIRTSPGASVRVAEDTGSALPAQ
jgi:GR25 family glycosyltransferase involved in LPS biosynthesis